MGSSSLNANGEECMTQHGELYCFSVARIEENLIYTPDGEFILRIVGQRCYSKKLTPTQANAWLKEHFPEWSWIEAIEEAKNWREKQAGILPVK